MSSTNIPKYLDVLYKRLTLLLERRLTNADKKTIYISAQKFGKTMKKGTQLDIITLVISDVFARLDGSANRVGTDTSEDPKELLIREMKRADLLAEDDVSTIDERSNVGLKSIVDLKGLSMRKLFNPKAYEKKVYILLDRRYRESENLERTQWSWSFSNTALVEPGSVNALGPIRDIVGVKIFEYFMNFDPDLYSIIEDDLYARRQTVLIHEFSAQSIIGPENRKYHFMGRVGGDRFGNLPFYIRNKRGPFDTIGLSERFDEGRAFHYNDGSFRFRKPITTIDRITISFGQPFTPLSLPRDKFKGTLVGGASVFVQYMELDGNHELPTILGTTFLVRTFITDFTTTDPVADADIIEYVNRPQGFNARNLFPYVANQIIFDLYGATYLAEPTVPRPLFASLVGTPLPCNVYISYYNFIIPIEITYLNKRAE